MGEVVNLRMARKRADRQAREREAEINRAAHSVPARERKRLRQEEELASKRLEAHRRETGGE